MRDIVLTLFTLCALIATLRRPYVGLMLWVLFSIMNPHQEVYSFAHRIPWNLIIAIVTTTAWIASSEPKLPPAGATTILVFLLLAWTTFNTFFAFDPSYSWTYWNRAWKILAMCVLAGTLTTNRVRFQALIWVVVLSLCFYGVKGGLFTLINRSGSLVFGPKNSMIFDNNTLADALVMILPIMYYLRVYTEPRALRVGILVAIILVVASILGSYSREAYIALTMVSIAFWLRTRNKLMYSVAAIIVLLPLLHFMPDSFYRRASSIQQYSTDASFRARLDSWWVAYRYAVDHIPFGAGFYGMNLRGVWDQYMVSEVHAAHSIYFQILGEQGVIGLVLYLLIIASSFRNLRAVRRDTKDAPDLAWARDLAGMMGLSLFAFCVAGAAAPIDFFDLFFLWAMLSAGLRGVTRKEGTPLTAPRPFARRLEPMPRPLHVPPS